jgi:hypothetical protein
MKRAVLALAAFAVVAAVVGAGASWATSHRAKASNELVGTVGPGFTISLTRDGAPVTELQPGLYFLTVHDLSAIHNFHVFGDGIDVEVTTVPFVGTVTVPLKIKDGTFTFQCDPHSTSMHGTFVGLGSKVKDKP